MSSSYFDAQPEKADPPAALLQLPEGTDLDKTSFLSPQVSRILDEIDLDEGSSSEGGESASSGDHHDRSADAGHERTSRRDLEQKKSGKDNTIRKTQTSPLPKGNKQRPLGIDPEKHPHLARFHSLRSMLFTSHIEDSMQQSNEEKMREQAGLKWKAEHDLRKGLNRPKTPETQSPSKDGLVRRMTGGLKRMSSKNSPPPMARIAEDNVSTASDDEDQDHSHEEDISHSDIEDLVRWVSKRDPPSDGEARKLRDETSRKPSKADSGHESLGQSDVDELVRWVSRKEDPDSKSASSASGQPHKTSNTDQPVSHHSYSDASTQSDSDEDASHVRKESINQNDVDELVRWVSHRDGPNAGPILKSKAPAESQDSPTDELTRWATKEDNTSGESLNASTGSLPILHHSPPQARQEPQTSDSSGSRLKREVSHSKPAATKSQNSLTHDDVDDLVQWVSKKNIGT